MNVVLDFETRSAADLTSCGAYLYSLHPTTEILCLAWFAPDANGLWQKGELEPGDLFQLLDSSDHVLAHNVAFDRYVWENVAVARLGWPEIPEHKWGCLAARSAAVSLPRKLELLAPCFGLAKDLTGHKLMLKLSRPAEPTKKEPNRKWHEKPEELARLGEYCIIDAQVEYELSKTVPELSRKEQIIWQVDQAVNRRGIYIDRDGVDKALAIIDRRMGGRIERLVELTGAEPTQRAKVLEWLRGRGADITSTKAESLQKLIGMDWPADVAEVLQIMLEVGKTSLAKYKAFKNYCGPDSRVRDTLLYAGASRTGRWAGRGIQTQNFPRGLQQDAMVELWERIHAGEEATLEELSNGLRGVICAPPGKFLYAGDYSAIEARGVLWLAGDERALDIFRRGEDIYLDMASHLYGRVCTKADKKERGVGKICILGLGYGMGVARFQEFAASSLGEPVAWDFAAGAVSAYRGKYGAVPKEWRSQENAAIAAVRSPGQAFRGGKRIIWLCEGDWLMAALPSSRKLYYYQPRVEEFESRFGGTAFKLTYLGENSYSHKWERISTWGGKLVENIVQAICRDLLAYALVRLERSGIFVPVLTVHDEVVSECDRQDLVKDYEALMSKNPPWAEGFPVTTEAKVMQRYSK